MSDGWSRYAVDYFPHTQEVVLKGQEIYSRITADSSRTVMPYNIADMDDLLAIDAFYQFAFSEQMIAHAAAHIGEYPVLVNMGLLRSDPTSNKDWVASQNLHLDVIATKILRVVVLINAVNENNGSLLFIRCLPLTKSGRIKKSNMALQGGL